MNSVLLNPLNQLETSLNTLITSLTSTNTYSAAPPAAQSLVDADDALSSALLQLRKHQENYARILVLRAEADRLQNQLRDTIRTCVDLRSEIGQIHPSILNDTDEDDDEDDAPTTSNPSATNNQQKRKNEPVDYETLLSFAARIGKHNAAAAIEAEQQSNRRQSDAEQHRLQAQNGSAIEDQNEPAQADNKTTQESLAELAAINDTLAQQRAYRGMAFPAAEALRMGELGRLQYLREQEGESAVEAEIERLIRESEKVTASETVKPVETSTEPVATKPEPARVEPERSDPKPPLQRPVQPQVALPPKPKIALDLDFFHSDDEDED